MGDISELAEFETMANVLKLGNVEGKTALMAGLILRKHRVAFSKGDLTLQSMAIQAVVKSPRAICKLDGNPFQRLPKDMVLRILTAVQVYHCKMKKDGILSYQYWEELVRLLLEAGQVTELDLSSWNSKHKSADILERLAVECCPGLLKLTKSRKAKEFDAYDEDWQQYETVNVNPDVAKLKNLRELRMRGLLLFNLEFLELTSWQNLEFLECTLPFQDFMNLQESHLTAFRTVKELHLNVDHRSHNNLAPKFLYLVQMLPGLETLGSESMSKYSASDWSQFVDEFSRWMPHRKLLIDFLFLGRHLNMEKPWPKGLGARTLSLDHANKSLIDRLVCQFPQENLQALLLQGLVFKDTCKLLEALGGTISRLHITPKTSSFCEVEDSLDLQKVFLLAPSLLAFDCHIFHFKGKIKALEPQQGQSFFKFMKRFFIEIADNGYHPEFQEYFKVFLVDSQAWDVLYFVKDIVLHTALETLKKHPTCGTRTRKLIFRVKNEWSMPRVFDLIVLLVLRSPNLKEVCLMYNPHYWDCTLVCLVDNQKGFLKILKAAGVRLCVKPERLSTEEPASALRTVTMEELEE